MSVLKKTFKGNLRQYSMLIALVAIVLLLQITTKGNLLRPMNVSNIVFQNAYVVILAVGMLICILTGGNIDLSVGSVLAMVMACASFARKAWAIDPYIMILGCLGIGILIGAWQGYWISYVGIPPFIVTLAGMLLFRGLTLIILNGETYNGFPKEFTGLFSGYIPDYFGGITVSGIKYNATALLVGLLVAVVFCAFSLLGRISRRKKGYEVGSAFVLLGKLAIVSAALVWFFGAMAQHRGVPTVLISMGIVLLAYSYLTGSTVIGRHLYAMGGNAKAAWLSGVNTKRLLFLAYTNMGFLTAVAGLICAARFDSAFPLAGQNYELDAIAACYIGGASASGGIGTVGGALIGALIMGTLNNGMIIMGVNQNLQQVVKGLVLLAAVAFDVISKNRYGFETAARFASWVKELIVPGMREKPIRTRLAGWIFTAAGVVFLLFGIYGFARFPAANLPGGLLMLAADAKYALVEGITITTAQAFEAVVIQHRILLTVLGSICTAAGVLLRLRRVPVRYASNEQNVKG